MVILGSIFLILSFLVMAGAASNYLTTMSSFGISAIQQAGASGDTNVYLLVSLILALYGTGMVLFGKLDQVRNALAEHNKDNETGSIA